MIYNIIKEKTIPKSKEEFIMFKKILYLHGIGSTGEGDTVKMLRERYPESEIISPELPASPKEAMVYINTLREEHHFNLVIGASLGGFYAMTLGGPIKILINPAMFASTDIPKAIGYGEHPYFKERIDGQKTYVIDDEYVAELKEIEDKYFNYCEDDEFVYETYAIFGTEDDVVSHIEDFKRLFREYRMTTAPFGHRMTPEIFNTILVPLMEKLYNDVEEHKKTGYPLNFINY